MLLCPWGILQARILEWVAMPSSRGYSRPRYQTCISCDSCITGRLFTAESQGNLTKKTGEGSLSILQGIFLTQSWTRVCWIAGRFFTSWVTMEATWSWLKEILAMMIWPQNFGVFFSFFFYLTTSGDHIHCKDNSHFIIVTSVSTVMPYTPFTLMLKPMQWIPSLWKLSFHF